MYRTHTESSRAFRPLDSGSPGQNDRRDECVREAGTDQGLSVHLRSDQFSLVTMLYEMAAGKWPSHGEDRVALMASPPAIDCSPKLHRRRPARKPKCRIRTKPRGSTCSKNRRRNSSTGKARTRCLFL